MKKENKIFWILCFTIVFMLSLWNIDICITALNFGGVLTNGFYIVEPAKLYHISITIAILSFFIVCLIGLDSGGKNENRK
jgi:hypothetical protein